MLGGFPFAGLLREPLVGGSEQAHTHLSYILVRPSYVPQRGEIALQLPDDAAKVGDLINPGGALWDR